MRFNIAITRKRQGETLSFYDIQEYLISLRVSEKIAEEAGEFEATLDNTTRKFTDFFQQGDEVEVRIAYVGEPLALLGTFTVDELYWEYPPDTVTASGLAVDVRKKQIRTQKARAWEKVSLAQVVQEIASENGLQAVVSQDAEEIRFEHIEQKQISDLAFLNDLSKDYDYTLYIRGGWLYFESRGTKKEASTTITRNNGDLKSYKFRWKTFSTYARVRVQYYDPEKKQFLEYEEVDPENQEGQTLVVIRDVVSVEQAKKIALAQLRRHNRRSITGEFVLAGNTSYSAGMNIRIAGFHKHIDGVYTVTGVTHRVSRSGFETVLAFERA